MAEAIGWEARIGRRLRLRDLHILSAVIKAGSMAKAAAQIGVSQPVISDAVADLETAVGVRLLDRSPRGVEPTHYGRALLRCSDAVFDELRQGVREIEHLADPASGEVRVGCPESLAAGVVAPVIDRLSRLYPRVRFRVSQVNTLTPTLEFPELRERKLDLVLARLIKPLGDCGFEADLSVEHLFDDQMMVVAGRNSRWARRRVIGFADLAAEPWILPPDSWNTLVLAQAFRMAGVDPPRTAVETFSVHLRYQLVATGRFLSGMPASVLLQHTRQPAIKVLDLDLPLRPWPVAMISLRDRTVSPIVQIFKTCVREICTQMGVEVTRRSVMPPPDSAFPER